VRTSLAYFNLSKVLQEGGGVGSGGPNTQGALSCAEMVVGIWRSALEPLVLGPEFAAHSVDDRKIAGASSTTASTSSSMGAAAAAAATGPSAVAALARLPVGPLQLMEVVDMLRDVTRLRERNYGPGHPTVGEAQFVTALVLLYLGESARCVVGD